MDSTCFTFGGQLFKQVAGAGIGLISSACVAKILMWKVDKLRSKAQSCWCIKQALYFRYIYFQSQRDGLGFITSDD